MQIPSRSIQILGGVTVLVLILCALWLIRAKNQVGLIRSDTRFYWQTDSRDQSLSVANDSRLPLLLSEISGVDDQQIFSLIKDAVLTSPRKIGLLITETGNYALAFDPYLIDKVDQPINFFTHTTQQIVEIDGQQVVFIGDTKIDFDSSFSLKAAIANSHFAKLIGSAGQSYLRMNEAGAASYGLIRIKNSFQTTSNPDQQWTIAEASKAKKVKSLINLHVSAYLNDDSSLFITGDQLALAISLLEQRYLEADQVNIPIHLREIMRGAQTVQLSGISLRDFVNTPYRTSSWRLTVGETPEMDEQLVIDNIIADLSYLYPRVIQKTLADGTIIDEVIQDSSAFLPISGVQLVSGQATTLTYPAGQISILNNLGQISITHLATDQSLPMIITTLPADQFSLTAIATRYALDDVKLDPDQIEVGLAEDSLLINILFP